MKVLLYNLNIGSGVEYTGNIIAQWCKEIEGIEFFEHKIQDPPCLTVNSIVNIQPDIIILNDNCPRVYEGSYYYKRFFPDKKIIYLTHGIKELNYVKHSGNHHYDYDRILLHIGARDYFDKIVSFKNEDVPEFLTNKVLYGCFPVNPTEYCIKTKWSDRKKDFCYIGQINKLKVSETFIRMMKEYSDIKIDFYGSIAENFLEKDCIDIIKKSKTYFGEQAQKEIPNILNKYKYFVMPHGRMPEIFNISLLQAMNCGTIPLIMNDTDGNFDHSWLKWAEGLYIHHNTEDQLFKTLKNPILFDESNYKVSEDISNSVKTKFDYFKFKDEFQTLLKGWL